MNEIFIRFQVNWLAFRHVVAVLILFSFDLGVWINTAYCIFAFLHFVFAAGKLFQEGEQRVQQKAEEKEG